MRYSLLTLACEPPMILTCNQPTDQERWTTFLVICDAWGSLVGRTRRDMIHCKHFFIRFIKTSSFPSLCLTCRVSAPSADILLIDRHVVLSTWIHWLWITDGRVVTENSFPPLWNFFSDYHIHQIFHSHSTLSIRCVCKVVILSSTPIVFPLKVSTVHCLIRAKTPV